jgi:hypothetical protein
MYKALLVIVCISVLDCSNRKTQDESRSKSFEERGITSDTCSFCAIDSLVVKSTNSSIETIINVDYAVAIELMDRVELVRKYEEKKYDTLMKLFKMKHWGDRNEIYRLYDLYGYYTQGIKPVLVDNSVTIIDTIRHERYITIKDGDKKYLIDLMSYRRDDGVLMFKPGKSPVYWTMKKEEDNCYGYYGFPKWYYNCP